MKIETNKKVECLRDRSVSKCNVDDRGNGHF